MHALIAEDDLTSRILLSEILEVYGIVHVAVDGEEALIAFQSALERGVPYSLICLDINMPKKNGQQVLKEIRILEKRYKFKESIILMTTSDRNRESVISSTKNRCNGYLVKPIKMAAITAALHKFKLI